MSDHIKEAAHETTPCAFGADDCPCLDPDIDHVFIHMNRMQIECHACGAREDIPLPGKSSVLQTMVEQHEGCERKGGRDA